MEEAAMEEALMVEAEDSSTATETDTDMEGHTGRKP